MNTLYATLDAWVTGVRDWLDADHLTDAQVAGFLNLAQQRLNRDLYAYEMEATENKVAASGSVTLPADFNRIRQVSIAGLGLFSATTKGEIVRLAAAKDDTERFFAIDAGSVILWPMPADGVIVTIDYYMTIRPISDAEPINIFTASYPDLMLWAALVEGSNFIVEDDRGQLFEAKYQVALDAANQKPKRIKLGSTPLRRPVKVM